MKQKKQLPDIIKVKILKGKSGIYIAELPDYDIFTEADSVSELIWSVNDLLWALFEIPKKDQQKIWYLPPWFQSIFKEKRVDKPVVLNKPVFFSVFFSPKLPRNYHSFQ